MNTAKGIRLNDVLTSSWLLVPMRLYIGVVFLVACVHKIVNPAMFAVDVATYQILPLYLINLMAIVLPWIELAAASMLILGFRARAAAVLTSGMMLVFIVAISVALSKGLQMSCGCFASQGAAEDPISVATVFRDLGWLAISLWIVFFDRKSFGLDYLHARFVQRRHV
ncbi:MAG TPA: MauE/DoxX family redox-associated membrane protein [Myxococcota bacterium]|nr:MauE/DoxX family redox-associated membrane protein [Myxococcota bacterium]HPB49840.1 MauE/DoxX family redox-associated membrane protein [Myxococcota bacterium]HQP94875.1 MauE/DoxX family redox-associated membrane protein [Myxococcota bacterium]